jgi:hypothetical protein
VKEKRVFGRHTDTTTMYLRETGRKGMDWNNLAHERDK